MPRPDRFRRDHSASSRRVLARCLALLLVACLTLAATAGCRPKSRGGEQVNVIGSTTVLPIAQAAADEFNSANNSKGLHVLVQGGGSSAGIEAVSTGRAQIGTSSRELKPEEAGLGLTDIPVAVDVIAVIVNPANPVKSITLNELRDIYTGAVSNWKQVGGFDEPISPVNRDEASGTREAFSKMVLQGRSFDPRFAAQPGTGVVRAAVAGSRDAIGYISLGYVTKDVKPLGLDGVSPTIDNVKAKRYKLWRTLHFLVKGKPSRATQAYIDYVLSAKVQAEIVSKAFLPVDAVKG